MTFRTTLRRLSASLKSARRAQPAQKSSLAVETLECRLVPATLAVDPASHLLTYTAGANVANNLTVSLNGATYRFRDTGEAISFSGPGVTRIDANTVDVAASSVGAITVNLGDK